MTLPVSPGELQHYQKKFPDLRINLKNAREKISEARRRVGLLNGIFESPI